MKRKVFAVLSIFMLLSFSGCGDSISDDPEILNVKIQTWQKYVTFPDSYGFLPIFTLFISFNASDSELWEERWEITLESEAGLSLANPKNSEKVDHWYTYPDKDNTFAFGWTAETDFSEYYDLLPCDEVRVLCCSLPEAKAVGEFPFRFRFENVNTGEVKYTEEFVLRCRLCIEAGPNNCTEPTHVYMDVIQY